MVVAKRALHTICFSFPDDDPQQHFQSSRIKKTFTSPLPLPSNLLHIPPPACLPRASSRNRAAVVHAHIVAGRRSIVRPLKLRVRRPGRLEPNGAGSWKRRAWGSAPARTIEIILRRWVVRGGFPCNGITPSLPPSPHIVLGTTTAPPLELILPRASRLPPFPPAAPSASSRTEGLVRSAPSPSPTPVLPPSAGIIMQPLELRVRRPGGTGLG
jgi:hypothetical protein